MLRSRTCGRRDSYQNQQQQQQHQQHCRHQAMLVPAAAAVQLLQPPAPVLPLPLLLPRCSP